MRRRKRKVLDLKYKIIISMIISVVIVILLFYSFNNNLYLTKMINDIFYYPFSNLTNDKDIIGENLNNELKSEIDSLKSLTNIDDVLSDFELINAVVVSRNPSYWLNEIVINKGSNDFIEEGMAVVVSEGLVGYITEVSSNSSRVSLITNPNYNNTSVRINDLYLVLEFDSSNNLIVNQLSNSDDIKEGDVIYTSGLTDKYPSGITIGYVKEIKDNTYLTGKILVVSLYYDINSIRYVSVLKRSIE